MGFLSKLFGTGNASGEVKKNEVNKVSDGIKKEVREKFLNDFFGVNLKKSPNADWMYVDSETNTSGDIVETYKSRISSPYFDFCEAKVIGNSATNFFFEADYKREHAFDIVFLIERDMLRGGEYNYTECARKYRDEILNEMCSLEWSIDGLDIRFYREDEGCSMTLGVWTKFYNESLAEKKKDNVQVKALSTHKTEKHDDVRLYYYDADGNECEKLIRDGEMWTTITGIRFRKNPEQIMASIYEGATVVLKPEPDNPVDPYAIAIYFKKELIGYVPKKDVPAILTCISPNGTDARIDKIEPKFIRVILAGTMEYTHAHPCLSKFRLTIVKDKDEEPEYLSYEDYETDDPIDDIILENDDDEEDDNTEYVAKEIAIKLPATSDILEIVRDNIERRMEGETEMFVGLLHEDAPTYINLTYEEILHIDNAEMEECLRKGYKVGFAIIGIPDTSNLSKEIGVKLRVLFEKAYFDNKLKELEDEMNICNEAINILEKNIEAANGGPVRHEGEFELEGDEEFDEDEMSEWEDYEIRMPFTDENEKQFMNIYQYLITGKFLCFKGEKSLGIGTYYCEKYDAYLKFRDSTIDNHIRNGNKAAFFIRNLDMTDRPRDIELTVALNLY